MKADYIKPSVYGKLYMIMQYENALALRTSLETGMRIGDVLSLEKHQLVGRTITFIADKTDKQGEKVISADLAKRLKQISGKKWIFTGRFGEKPRVRSTVWKDVKKASKLIGLEENASCHSARKTYAVDLFHSDGIGAVKRELQHDRLDTSMLYAFSDLLVGKGGKTAKRGTEPAELVSGGGVAERQIAGFDDSRIEKLADLVATKVVNKLHGVLTAGN